MSIPPKRRKLGFGYISTAYRYASGAWLHVADQVFLMYGPEDYICGPTPEVMTEDNLSRLYGLPIRAAVVSEDGRDARTMVPVFG